MLKRRRFCRIDVEGAISCRIGNNQVVSEPLFLRKTRPRVDSKQQHIFISLRVAFSFVTKHKEK